jgi:hypothetical protein
VTQSFDPGALLSQSYPLPRGPRVRLRLPARRDERAIAALLERNGVRDHELAAARLARADPRRRIVICAMGLVGLSETLLGVGEITLGDEEVGEPTIIAVDDELTEGLEPLLARALIGRATAIRRSRAA